jgi:hypothetical protein
MQGAAKRQRYTMRDATSLTLGRMLKATLHHGALQLRLQAKVAESRGVHAHIVAPAAAGHSVSKMQLKRGLTWRVKGREGHALFALLGLAALASRAAGALFLLLLVVEQLLFLQCIAAVERGSNGSVATRSEVTRSDFRVRQSPKVAQTQK